MKILLIHAEKIWYKTRKPAVKNPPDPPGEFQAENAAVVFTSIEKGDGNDAVERAKEEIIKYARETVKADWIVIYPYAHLSSNLEKPIRAHKILLKLENSIKNDWNGKIHRAPFGWYKEFNIHGKGHPLAELSRQIVEGERPISFKIDTVKDITIHEAIEKNLIPSCLGKRIKKLKGLIGEKVEVFGLNKWDNWLSTQLLLRLFNRLLISNSKILNENIINEPYFEANPILTLEQSINIYKIIIQRKVLAAGAPLFAKAVKTMETTDILEEMSPYILERVKEIPLCGEAPCLDAGIQGKILIYKSHLEYCYPIAYKDNNDKLIIGPLGNLIHSIIDNEVYKAENSDWIPRLPIWMHPITVYIIPVGETLEYAKTLAKDLTSIGINVIIDHAKEGLGTKVRKAGKLWIPIIATIGEKEVATGTVTIRRRWKPGSQEVVTIGDLILELKSLIIPYGNRGIILYSS